MNRLNRQQDFDKLRQDYPFFEYQSYEHHQDETGLHLHFVFNISDRYQFRPQLFVPAKDFYQWHLVGKQGLDNLVFHIGMIELISYWKLTCSPQIVIRPHSLSDEQIEWWKKLYFNGLGEFLYLNGIDTAPENLMKIRTEGKLLSRLSSFTDMNKVMVPIGGGKDSVVTLEVLKTGQAQVFPMAVNIRPAISRTIQQAGFGLNRVMEVQRRLDPLMLELNQQGFLNGHTPFSAMLAFTTVLLAAGSGTGNIALSNESSANESTVPGTKINHQYSKSFEFEQDFDRYCNDYIHPDIHYFSFLRPLNELQIAGLFSKLRQHHHSFRSCNAGSKDDRWCGVCPKCLFTYLILTPFIPEKELVDIFGGNLLNNKSLAPYFLELTGVASVKPFECVGTPEEVNVAISKAFSENRVLPPLMKEYIFDADSSTHFAQLMSDFSEEHAIASDYLSMLKKALHDQLT